MPRPNKITDSPPAAVKEALERLGENIRTARVRRKMTQDEMAQRVGVSRFVVSDMEKGKPSTSIAAYMGALWVLGLLSHMNEVGDPIVTKKARSWSAPEAQKRPGVEGL